MPQRRLTPTERMIAAEARAVEDGHHARLDRDGRHFLVRSDSWADVDYRVRITSVGETVVFECDHWCYGAETGDKVRGRQAARTYVPCKHGALGARRLEREGLLRWDGFAWRPTPKAQALAGADVPPDPFANLPT